MRSDISKMAEYYKALGDEKRLLLIKILASHNEKSFCVSQLADMLKISQPAVSQHLKVLKNVMVVNAEKVANRVYYTINMNTFIEYGKLSDQLFKRAMIKCDDAKIRGDIPCEDCKS